MKINTYLTHYGITVSNLESSIDFYKKNFGFKKIREFDKPVLKLRGAILQLNNSLLELLEPYSKIKKQKAYEKKDLSEILKKTPSHLAIAVSDVDNMYVRLEKEKVRLMEFNEDLFFCYDPDNLLIEIRRN